MKRLIVSDRALTDMAELIEYIHMDRPKVAARLHDRLWREFDQLCLFPNLGHRREDVNDGRYRFKRVKSFLIAYRVEGDDLRVVRVLHGARDFRRQRFD